MEMKPRLAEALELLKLSDRDWHVLEARLGLNEEFTLAQVAVDLNVTRQRVRQIEAKAVERIDRRLSTIQPILDLLEANSHELGNPIGQTDSAAKVIAACRAILTRAGWQPPHQLEVERLLTAIRALVDARKPVTQSRWPRLSFVACALPPVVQAHFEAAAEDARWKKEEKERTRTLTYEELAERVLMQAIVPLHWQVIADRADAMRRRSSFSATALFNALIAHDDTFVRVAPGTYALKEWGHKKAITQTDLVAAVLHEAKRPLTYGAILQAASQVQKVKNGSLQMMLDLDARFYRSEEDTYGLRAWLPPRERQTLRSPKWQVEAEDSFRRVARATENGYNVLRIVDQDRSSKC